MFQRLRYLLPDRSGATAIEYGLIAALIVLGMMAGLSLFADTAIEVWNNVSDEVAANA